MTEPSTPPTAPDDPDTLEPADDEVGNGALPTSEPDATEATGRGNPEAARYRKQLRATQVENTVLQAKVEQMMRNEVQRVAGEHLADGADIFREPIDIDTLCDDLGLIDPAKVAAHAETLTASHPHWARRGPATPSAANVTSNTSPYNSPPQANWTEVLKGGAGG